MIIGKLPSFIKVDSFVAGLTRAAEGVLHVTVALRGSGNPVYSTAWLITDTLLVLPFYTLDSQTTCLVRSASLAGDAVEATLISTPPSPSDRTAAITPVVLRLRHALPSRGLPLAAGAATEMQRVTILHHPRGEPDLYMSLGTLHQASDQALGYDADTEQGSGGAPVFDESWQVIGMHVAGWDPSVSTVRLNQGVALPPILAALRNALVWDEVAQYHNLVDLSAARAGLESMARGLDIGPGDDVLLRAAVHWSLDPTTLPATDAARLKGLVISPADATWVLRANERQRLLRSAGSLDALRAARGHGPVDDPRQAVIDAILAGPPYELDKIDDASLPYWLQAVRWFADVAPLLPTAAQVNLTLERRRVRSRLRDAAGPAFRGRTAELAQLVAWYGDTQTGPMVVSGIGGIGKSALVAHFALTLPQETLLLWLDFDRADIAPDDAVSVLRLLCEQATVQIDGFPTLSIEESTWQQAAGAFGDALARSTARDLPPLLVMDGFEVAQYVQKHEEIWGLLALIQARLPGLRILVSGRAPVTNLALAGRPAASLPLAGLAKPDAAAWLRQAGVTDGAVLARVLALSGGVPLVLMLIERWLDAGGNMRELPERLPRRMIEGFLYQRILDRVIDPELKPLARRLLVLRRITAEMRPAGAGASLPEGMDAATVFALLEREMALVSREDAGRHALPAAAVLATTGSVLRLRPEVRSATLRLLEVEDPALVADIDRIAAAWYAGQDLDQPANAAELVYHRLRLGDIAGAEAVWRDDLAGLLLYAEDDMRESAQAERDWLRRHTSDAALQPSSQEAWEAEALVSVRTAIGRGLLRAVPEILAERAARSAASPLVVYDAWQRWQNGELDAARGLLAGSDQVTGPVGRTRSVLAALLASRAGEREEADRLLAQIEDEARWPDWDDKALAVLAVRAARIHLTVDVEAEFSLAGRLDSDTYGEILARALAFALPPSDVLFGRLAAQLAAVRAEPDAVLKMGTLESVSEVALVEIPIDANQLPAFAESLDRVRQASMVVNRLRLPVAPGEAEPATVVDLVQWLERDVQNFAPTGERSPEVATGLLLGANLALLGYRRWRTASASTFLADACVLAQQREPAIDPLRASIAGVLALFRGHERSTFRLTLSGLPLGVLLDRASAGEETRAQAQKASRWSQITQQMQNLQLTMKTWQAGSAGQAAASRVGMAVDPSGWSQSRSGLMQVIMETLSVKEPMALDDLTLLWTYVNSPDPLEALTQRLLGMPDVVGK